MNKNKYKIPFDQNISINTFCLGSNLRDIFEECIRKAVDQRAFRILLTDSSMQLENESYFWDLNSILSQLTQSMGINVE